MHIYHGCRSTRCRPFSPVNRAAIPATLLESMPAEDAPEDGVTERTGVVLPPSRVSSSVTTNGSREIPKGGRR